jgi:hypothetical protein
VTCVDGFRTRTSSNRSSKEGKPAAMIVYRATFWDSCMSNGPVPDLADAGTEGAWVATRGTAHYSVAVPDEKAARPVGGVPADRGHRWVTVVPLHRLRRLP